MYGIFEDMESTASNAELLCGSGTSLEKVCDYFPSPSIQFPPTLFTAFVSKTLSGFIILRTLRHLKAVGLLRYFPVFASSGPNLRANSCNSDENHF
jgi:hypothetical protein